DDDGAVHLNGAGDMAADSGEIADVRRFRRCVEAEYRDRLPFSEHDRRCQRVGAGYQHTRAREMGDCRVDAFVAGVTRVIVGDIADDSRARVSDRSYRGSRPWVAPK